MYPISKMDLKTKMELSKLEMELSKQEMKLFIPFPENSDQKLLYQDVSHFYRGVQNLFSIFRPLIKKLLLQIVSYFHQGVQI